MTLDEVIAFQRERGLVDVHVVHIGESRFAIAHTDDERAQGALESCDLHGWLTDLSGPPVKPGLYIAHPHVPDAYSEPYGADPWNFEPTGEGT